MRFVGILMWGCGPELPETVDFDEDVRPIVETHCLRCHNARRSDAGIVLETAEQFSGLGFLVLCASTVPEVQTDPTQCDGVDVASMPPGAIGRMERFEQRLVVRWLEENPP